MRHATGIACCTSNPRPVYELILLQYDGINSMHGAANTLTIAISTHIRETRRDKKLVRQAEKEMKGDKKFLVCVRRPPSLPPSPCSRNLSTLNSAVLGIPNLYPRHPRVQETSPLQKPLLERNLSFEETTSREKLPLCAVGASQTPISSINHAPF